MQIEFLKDVPVDPATVPKTAVGRLRIRQATIPPSFSPKGVKPPKAGPVEYCFRKGATVDLPDEQAAGFVERGEAKVATNAIAVRFVEKSEMTEVLPEVLP